jgi:5-methylcytosine-specific restriction endonuclease McrA
MAHSEERRAKISQAMKRYYEENPERKKVLSEKFKEIERDNPEAFWSGRQKGGEFGVTHLNSLLEASSRTVRKVLKRLGKGCSRCQWSEGGCDLHHIRGRKGPNPDHHDNLTLLCPNCHRLAHERKIDPKDLVTLTQYIGDDWKAHYYGEKQ